MRRLVALMLILALVCPSPVLAQLINAAYSYQQGGSTNHLEVNAAGVMVEGVTLIGGAANCIIRGAGVYLLNISDENGDPVWCDLSLSPTSVQCSGNECRGGRVLRDSLGVRTDSSLGTSFIIGGDTIAQSCNPTAMQCDAGGVEWTNIADPTQPSSAVNRAFMALFTTGSPDATEHKDFGYVQGETGVVRATGPEGRVRFVGGTTNVDTKCKLGDDGVPECLTSVTKGDPAAFKLKVDKNGCTAGGVAVDPTNCGTDAAPCCTIPEAFAMIPNDQGFATCTLEPKEGCGRGSISTDVQCNEDRDLPGNTCSVTTTTQCDRNSDCPTGERCVVTEHCVATDSVCSDVSHGTCGGPAKRYTIEVGAGTYDGDLTSSMFRPGSIEVTGFSPSMTTIRATGDTKHPPNAESYSNPDECVIDLTNTAGVALSHFQIQAFASNGICVFGDTQNLRLEHLDLVHFGPESWDYIEGPSRDGRFHGRNISTRTIVGMVPFGYGTKTTDCPSGNGMQFSTAHRACSESWGRACDTDVDCPPTETCTMPANSDIAFSIVPSFVQPAWCGGAAIWVRGQACGSGFNLNFDYAIIQASESHNDGRKNVGLKVTTETCEGPLNPDTLEPGRLAARHIFRPYNDVIRGNADAVYGISDADISLWLGHNVQMFADGFNAYDPCTRVIEPGAEIIYARAETAFVREHTGGNSDLGYILCDEPNQPQNGEVWTVAPNSGTSHAGERRRHAGGVTRTVLEGAFDPDTNATQFGGAITNTITSTVAAAKAFLVSTGNGTIASGIRYAQTLLSYTTFGRDVHTAGYGANGANGTADVQGRPGLIVQQDPHRNAFELFRIPSAVTWTPTITQTPSSTPTPTDTPTPTATSTAPTLTPTGTPTDTATRTVTNTRTFTPTWDTVTTFTVTQTRTVTYTKTPTKTLTPTYTATITRTPTIVPSSTRAPEKTRIAECTDDICGAQKFWVGDVTKDYGAASNTPKLDCVADAPATPCSVIDPQGDSHITNQKAVKTIVAQQIAGIPTFTPTNTWTATPTWTATSTWTPSNTPTATPTYTATNTPDHGTLSGLGDDDHTQYALLAGRSGGQILYGGTASGDDLSLYSTSNATKGTIFMDSNIEFPKTVARQIAIEDSTASGSAGGALTIKAGAGTSGNANGGAVTINSGNATGIGQSGLITIASGSGGATSKGITMTTGAGSSDGDAGAVAVTTGAATGGTSADGGDITLTCGTGSGTTDGGGDFSAVAGAGTTNGNGGDVNLTVGAGAGTGTTGKINVTGHVVSFGTVPTVSSCGTSPSVNSASADGAGRVTTGTGVFTACTITFAVAWINAPVCIVQIEGTVAIALAPSTTTTALTITGASALTSTTIGWICQGFE